MDILYMLKEINMQWNLMDVGIMDVHDVIPVIERIITGYGKDNATTIRRNAIKKSSTRIGIYSSQNVVLRLQIIPYIK